MAEGIPFWQEKSKNIQIRLRGDNPANWISEKQSFRVKLRKSEMHDRKRYFNYTFWLNFLHQLE